MNCFSNFTLTLTLSVLTIFSAINALAEIGVSDTEIKIGMSNATSGPAKALGSNLRDGAQIYFDKINSNGGVHGRQIKVISYDDGYEPVRTIINTKKLIEKDKVFALFGYVGTPTSKVAVPIASKVKIPYLFPFTGAEFLRNPVNKYVFNIRSSYFDETEAIVDHLVNDLGIRKVGAFIQNDGYGAAGRAGIQRALEKHGLKMAVVGKYERNTVNVRSGLNKIISKRPEAVIMVGAYKPCAAFIKEAKKIRFNPIFSNISFVGTNALVEELGSAGNDSYISQVVPHPISSKLSIVQQYRKDLKAAGKENILGFGSLEGYIDAYLLIKSLEKHGADLTREGFIKTLENMNFDADGLKFMFSDSDHQGLARVYLTKIKNGKAVSVKNFKE